MHPRPPSWSRRVPRRFASRILAACRARRPGPRGTVTALAALLVLVLALTVAETVANHLTATAIEEAVAGVETIVRGDLDPRFTAATMEAPSADAAAAIDARLERLASSGELLRVKVWRPDGTVMFSDLPALRGRTLEMSHELAEALDGHVETELTVPDAAENLFERGLASHVLEVYLPLRDPATGAVIGAYEVYRDAAGIEAAIIATRQDALVQVGLAGAGLLLLLYLGFRGTARILDRQNRQLRGRAAAQELLAADLRRSEQRFRSLVHNSADIIAVVDRTGHIQYSSPAVERILGYGPSERTGRSMLDVVHPDDLELATRMLDPLSGRANGMAAEELRIRHRDGSWRVLEVLATDRLDDSAVGGIVLNSHDVTDRKRLEDELTRQAFRDGLTGLANRALFVDRVIHALARRGGEPVALLFLDLDDFKSVNDLRGHAMGDRLLAAVGARITGVVREMDSVARLGGDEFAVLIEDASDTTATVEVAERILSAFALPVRVEADDPTVPAEEVSVRASIGIAMSSPTLSADQLLSNADLAMYQAKGAGGDRYALFDAAMSAGAIDRLSLKADLGGALGRGELSLVYQPIVDLTTGRTTKLEALLRWRHPERGSIPPSVFVPLAERSGVIVEIGRWVLGEACRQLAALGAEGDGICISVNLSARQLGDEDLVDVVRTTLARHGLAPERLVLEMTESALIRDLESGIRMMNRLHDLGVRLAIDDFGTGYSSLSYLHRFPVDFLKIDRSFITTLGADDESGSLARTIVEMGRTLGLATIAEGIEDPDQLTSLQRMGATMGQGYLLARPMPIDRLRWYLRADRELPVPADAPGRAREDPAPRSPASAAPAAAAPAAQPRPEAGLRSARSAGRGAS